MACVDEQNIVLVVGDWQVNSLSALSYPRDQVGKVVTIPACPTEPISYLSPTLAPLPHDGSEAQLPSCISFLNQHAITKVPALLRKEGDSFVLLADSLEPLQSSDEPFDSASLLRTGLNSYEEMRMTDALIAFDQLLTREPNHAEALFNAACIYHFWSLPILAVPYLERVLQANSTDAVAHTLLWNLATSSDDPPPLSVIIATYERLASRGDAQATTRLSVLTGKGDGAVRTDREYVRHVFDNMASVFEEKLTQHLQYDAPWILEQQIASFLTSDQSAETAELLKRKGNWRIFDLGCGSGLCAKVFRDYFAPPSSDVSETHRSIASIGNSIESAAIGVDISPKMVDICHGLSLYSSLSCADVYDALHEYLSALSSVPEASRELHRLDMVIAADTFVYVGALGRFFHLTQDILKKGGLFAFSTEDLDLSPMKVDNGSSEPALDNEWEPEGAVPGWGAKLLKSARFGHSNRYIEELAGRYHFRVVAHTGKTLRTEGTTPLQGSMFVLQKL